MLAEKLTIFLLKKFFAKLENGELIVELPSGQKVSLARPIMQLQRAPQLG